ncbi:MAG TPA: Xaa-Pro peptidase family protein [Solirubrobacteraceae bacterium]|nr:Xaa-Pro peptidase family protein [Solirubrobacteraceae bacterium]
MTGSSGAGERRAARLRECLAAADLDALLVTTLVDARYLTGFTGSSAVVVAVPDGGVLLTDFRYTEQSAAQVQPPYEPRIVTGEPLEKIGGVLPAGGRLGFDERAITVREHGKLGDVVGPAWELVAVENPVAKLREVKEADEVAALRAAAEIADAAMSEVLEAGLVGRSERDVATALEFAMRRRGATSASFPSIVAAGEHGSRPHAEVTDAAIASDVLVTIDWGALHAGYCSDCTRTFATGEGVGELEREIYDVTLKSQLAGLQFLAAGRTGREVDAAARAVIDAAGYGENFGHGLGHGVGLEIHEPPRLAKLGGDAPLVIGNAVTVEPGIYIAGTGGVRIEDLVVVGDGANEILTSLSKDLTFVA